MVESEYSLVQEEELNVDECLPSTIEGQEVSIEHVSCYSDNYTANKNLDSSVEVVEQKSSHSELTDDV